MWEWKRVAWDEWVQGQACATKVDSRSVIGEEATIGDGREGVEVEGKKEFKVVRLEGCSVVIGEALRLDIRVLQSRSRVQSEVKERERGSDLSDLGLSCSK